MPAVNFRGGGYTGDLHAVNALSSTPDVSATEWPPITTSERGKVKTSMRRCARWYGGSFQP